MKRVLQYVAIAPVVLGLGWTLDSAAQTPAAPASKAATTGNAGASALGADDRKFVESAAMDGMAEVELGKLAQQKAASDAVKQFGGRMVTDHSKANDELKRIAGTKGVSLPTSMDKKHQKDVDELSKSSRFDHEYMELMVKEHKKDVSDFRKHSKSSKDPDVQGFASKTLPTLEEHLQLAQQTQKGLKSSPKK
jgi:putative membrane protein